MQFRERGNKVLMIRTEYRPEKKRTYGVTVASQDKHLSTISEDVRQLLTSSEVDELEQWLADRAAKQSVDNAKASLSTAALFISDAAAAMSVEQARQTMTAERAAGIYAAVDELTKQLRRAGFSRSKLRRS